MSVAMEVAVLNPVGRKWDDALCLCRHQETEQGGTNSMWKRKRTKRFYRPLFAGGMALALFAVVPSARGQQPPDQSQQDQSQQTRQADQQRDRDNPNPDLR